MSNSRLIVPLAGLLAIAAAAIFVAVSATVLGNGDESKVKTVLMDAGALVVVNPNGKSVGTVNLSTIQDESRLQDLLNLVAELQHIQALDLNRTAIMNPDLEIVSSMTSLVSLSLKSTDIDDKGLAHLSKLTRLESLHLNDTGVTDMGLDSLQPLNSLKVLDLSGTQVGDDLMALAELSDLEWLVLNQLSLSDDALDGLVKLPKLKRLTLRDSNYPESSVKNLLSLRPGVQVDE